MSEELLKKFAKSLQEQRDKKGITLQQVSAKTRIDIKFLKAIEAGEFNIMPTVYIRAFIKDYADVVELDAAEILNKFEAAMEGKQIDESLLKPEDEPKDADTPQKSKMEFISPEVNEKQIENNNVPKSTNLIIFILGGLLIISAIYFLFLKPSSTEIIMEKPFNQVLNEKQRFETTTKQKVDSTTDSSVKTFQNATPFSLTLISTDTVWLRLRIDNKIDKEFTLKPNEKEIISAQDNIKLLVGNLGGIKFILNNKTYKLDGVKGEVQNLLVNRTSIQKIKVNQIKVNE